MTCGLPCGMASRDIVLCFFLTALLYSTFGQTTPKSEVQPEFLAFLENHTVTQGRGVAFTCVVNHLQSYLVAWIKSDSRAILALNKRMVTHNTRLSVTHNGHNTWKLHVNNVQPSDSGSYMCQINTNPMKSQTGHMKVVIPPDIVDVDHPAGGWTVKEKSDLRLSCHATGTPKPKVTWRREDNQPITIRTKHGVKQEKTYKGEELLLTGILREDMGVYLCIASNGVPPSISKRYDVNVQFKPQIEVPIQLVGAPANTYVVLKCSVESSPKGTHAWYKDGVKLMPDDKHTTSETAINDYSYQSSLMWRVNKTDFGTYTCTAENSFGKANGTIRLIEQSVQSTMPSSAYHNEFLDKHAQGKQADKKGKGHGYVVGREDAVSPGKNTGNLGQSTLMSRRNTSDALTGVNSKKTKVSWDPAPTPASAHSAPTQTTLDVQSRGTAHDYRPLSSIGLTIALVVFATSA